MEKTIVKVKNLNINDKKRVYKHYKSKYNLLPVEIKKITYKNNYFKLYDFNGFGIH